MLEPVADPGNIQAAHESTSLFQRPEQKSITRTQLVASAILACSFITTGALIVKWSDEGRVVVPLTGAAALQLWLLTRILSGEPYRDLRELILVVTTPEVYPLFAVGLQYFVDRPSRASAYVLLISYLVYFYTVSGFLNRSTERVVERLRHPHHVQPIFPSIQVTPPCYACSPKQQLGYNAWQVAKVGVGLWGCMMDLHLSAPYNLLAIVPGTLLIGDGVGELLGSTYFYFCDRSLKQLRPILVEEGEPPQLVYSCSQKSFIVGKEILENYSLFAASTISGLALHFQLTYLLLPAGVGIGLHQHFAKRELADERNWEPMGDPFKKKVSQIIGYSLASLIGTGMCSYAVVECLARRDLLTIMSAINMVTSAAFGFISSRAISNAWDKNSGVVLTALREHMIDNPVLPAYVVIIVNHAADQPVIARLGGTILGEFGLSTAAILLASESARILDTRVVYRIIRISPAAAVVLGHMIVPLTKAITNLRW